MAPPWSIRVQDQAPLALVAVTRGQVWLQRDGQDPQSMDEGSIALIQGPDSYCVSDSLGREPTIVILPGNDCRSLDGRSVAQSMLLGVRTWGTASLDGPPGPDTTEMLIGTYESVGAVGQRLLTTLPPSITTTADALDSPLVDLLSAEIDKAHPGQTVVLDRLLDLLVVAVLRSWLTSCSDPGTSWFQSHLDDVVGRALSLMHDHPDHPWTVASLAAEVGVSRAALARRFNDLVGQPPMTYLTDWRLTLAADLLAEPGATVTSVAHQVGYATPFAFSTAFKRVRGLSPADHRRLAHA